MPRGSSCGRTTKRTRTSSGPCVAEAAGTSASWSRRRSGSSPWTCRSRIRPSSFRGQPPNASCPAGRSGRTRPRGSYGAGRCSRRGAAPKSRACTSSLSTEATRTTFRSSSTISSRRSKRNRSPPLPRRASSQPSRPGCIARACDPRNGTPRISIRAESSRALPTTRKRRRQPPLAAGRGRSTRHGDRGAPGRPAPHARRLRSAEGRRKDLHRDRGRGHRIGCG